ncbi:MAG: flagellar basal body-associated protein FliL [Gammaproteobacteria bacterium]|nr:flagellar basal body-associated protein FliL [Gammaproteobacteria bacterium]MBU1554829.1 flagellar basal body-associated protein FliL [Gammaproteobacteria bacterium]MBU2070084.1 flagellar basal body-associated protein FliL [Gammaproteobacteria bacterium]MBU2183620.1 flagellar basal body-associated protein FliL [Gammaproteobacteria bacterium]MBU2205618.1 flagellar basal body-associated protein FliL [Gammaproteobacteria bacterium]
MIKSLLLSLLLLAALPTQAQEQPKEIVYYGFDPDIVTNYISGNRRSLGYIRITVELMIEDKSFLPAVEHHEPLILDIIYGTISKQPEDKIKSLTGREEIRLALLDKLQQAMKKEAGATIIRDLLFTKYLYQ